MKKPVEESTSRERGKLKRKEEATTAFASALITWRESTEEVRRAWAVYRAETGVGRKSAAERLHTDNAEQNIIMAAPSPSGPAEGESAPDPVSPSDMPVLDGPAAA